MIKVDNAKFVQTKEAEMILEGCLAFVDCAIKTGRYKTLNKAMAMMLMAVLKESVDTDDGMPW